jgi:UDP-galactopyranose mutase
MGSPVDLICFSHLRWDFVYQRPQHLLSRAVRDRRVYFVEEPAFGGGTPHLELHSTSEGVTVVRPMLPDGMHATSVPLCLRSLLDELLQRTESERYVLWFYSAKAMAFARDLEPAAVVYDRVDELPAFPGAADATAAYEAQLLAAADLVFTVGPSAYETTAPSPRLHAFPGGVDAAHFALARGALPTPPDQAAIPRPRVGYLGPIDERLDLDLVAALADLRPDLQLVMLGPVVVGPARLPHRDNLHWLGRRAYDELPAYLAGWDVALLPLARNASTRATRPTRMPEYLAAGRPVVATPVPDVVGPYRPLDLVHVADTAPAMARAIDDAMHDDAAARLARADRWLARISWDRTWEHMDALIAEVVAERAAGRA